MKAISYAFSVFLHSRNGALCLVEDRCPIICSDYVEFLMRGQNDACTHFTLHMRTSFPKLQPKSWWCVWLEQPTLGSYWYWRLSDDSNERTLYPGADYMLNTMFGSMNEKLRKQHKPCKFRVWLKLTSRK